MPVDLDEVSTSSEVGIETIHNAEATLLTVEAWAEGFTWDHSLPSAKSVSRIQSDHQPWLKPQNRRSRPALISVVMKIDNIKQWIKLREVGNGMPHQIDVIDRNGPFVGTPLRKGDFLIHLGDEESNWALKREGHIRGILQGEISRRGPVRLPVVFETEHGDPEVAEAVVFKESKNSRVGLAFMNVSGQLQIKVINPKGLLGPRSALRVGDSVEFINDIPVSNLPAETAVGMLKDLVGKVSIRVRSPPTPNPSMRHQQLSTPARSTSDNIEWDIEAGVMLANEVQIEAPSYVQPMFIGIRTSVARSNPQTLERVIMYHTPDDSSGYDYNNDDKFLNVTFVSKRGPFDAFPLEVGDVVRCKSRPDPEKKEVYAVLKRPTGTPGVVCAVAHVYRNAGVPLKLGLTFRADQGAPLRIGRVHDFGLFGESILASGDTVIAMNGIPCHYMTPEEAVALSQRLIDMAEHFTMLVRTREDRAIVVVGHDRQGESATTFVIILFIVGFAVVWIIS